MRINNYFGVLILSCLALRSTLAQSPANLNGSFPVTESWSATIQVGTGTGIATRTYSGTETGTLSVSNGVYSLINRTGAATLPRAKRTITYYSFGDDYYIGGTDPGIGGGPGGFFVEVPLTFFAIKVPLGATGGFSGGDPSQSSAFAASGPSLGDLSGSGTYVDVNYPDSTSGYLNELDSSSTAALTLPPIPPMITTPPISQVVAVGANVSFSVAASGTPTPTFQWKHNGTTIGNSGGYSGAMTPTLSIAAAQTKDAGTYTVVASNSKGSATASVTLTVAAGQMFTNLYNFPGGGGGAVPTASVGLSGNILYGTSLDGGISGDGMVFALNSDGANFANLHSFSATGTNSNDAHTNSDGAYSYAGLAISGNILYGTTESGGYSGSGTVFAINNDGTGFTNLYTFSEPFTNGVGFNTNSDGMRPVAGLVLSGNTLYGTASYGGTAGWGTVFAVNTDGSGFTNLYDFTNGDDGAVPAAGLILLGKTLYGTASGGGAPGNGTVFALNTNGNAFTVLYAFSETDTNGFNNDGAVPQAGLIASNNTVYGTAAYGGNGGNGTVFAVNTDGSHFTTLHSFSPSLGGATVYYDVTNGDGANPYSGLALSGNTLYGTASSGGAGGDGTVFSINTDEGGFTILYSFSTTDNNGYNSDGASPEAGLTLSGNTLYGTATSGGTNGSGAVFSLSLEPPSVSQGALQVLITPPGAVTAGAHWQVDNGTLQNSGATVNLSVGSHVVSFVPTPGWAPSGQQTVVIANGTTAKITGVYLQGTPKLTITSPKASQSVSDGLLLVTGTVTDKAAVDKVYYQLNGGNGISATSINFWTNWTASITLSPGANTISAYAVDSTGVLSPTNTVMFKFIPSATLTVQTNGFGGITPVDNGKLLAIGTNYTLTASLGKNWLFSNWVGGTSLPYTVLSTSNPYTFSMQSNLVIEANFVTNLFLAAQGPYHGLFAPTGVLREETNSGSFTLNLLSTGAFSGDLFLGSNTVSLAGKFDVSGHVQTNSTVKSGKRLTTILQLDLANQAVSGSVSDGSFVAQLDGDQNVFGPGHPAADYAGQYTWTLPGTNDSLVGPYGTSYGTLTVSALGVITFAGNLADGTTVSQSSAVSKDGRWPMYLPSSNPNESVFGWNYFTNQTLTAPAFVSWINVTNKAKSALYPFGFTNQEAAIVASYYTATDKPLLSLTEAQVTLEGGNLPFNITNQITLATSGTITVPVVGENTNKLKLTITPKNGLITGSFQNPANAKQTITINGVLLQNQTNAQGYFLGTNQSGAFLLQNP